MIAVALLTLAAVIGIFSVQNTAAVNVSFLIWKFETSFASIVFFAVFSGILVAQLLQLLKTKSARGKKTLDFVNRRWR